MLSFQETPDKARIGTVSPRAQRFNKEWPGAMKKHNTNTRASKINDIGFTLIETLMAISILSFGMLATGALLVGIINGNRTSKDMTTATILAQDKIEDLRDMGYSDLPSANSSVTEDYGSITYSNNGETVNYPDFKRERHLDQMAVL
jgi:prepilin-type N-terminal cleavage/methylation domain-containing protein